MMLHLFGDSLFQNESFYKVRCAEGKIGETNKRRHYIQVDIRRLTARSLYECTMKMLGRVCWALMTVDVRYGDANDDIRDSQRAFMGDYPHMTYMSINMLEYRRLYERLTSGSPPPPNSNLGLLMLNTQKQPGIKRG